MRAKTTGRFMMRLQGVLILALMLGGWGGSAWGGGPLLINNRQAVVWPSRLLPIQYSVDRGPLGQFTNATAVSLIRQAFSAWQAVTDSNLRVNLTPQTLPEDVTARNYQTYLSRNDLNPFIFDNDGEIVDDILGAGSKEHILGLSSPYYIGNDIVGAIVILNGYFLRQNNYIPETYYPTVVHEIGHLFGLDHAQFLQQLVYNRVTSDDRYLSIMYPTSSDDDRERDRLTFDDQIALRNLYPSSAHQVNTGAISGRVRRGSTELPGVNVIAINTSDPVMKISTMVTGTIDPGQGSYTVAGLPAGNYQVMVEAIYSGFTGSSSVGQYSETTSDRSFVNPVRSEFYNENDRQQEAPSTASVVPVSRGRTTTGIDFQAEPGSLPQDEVETVLLGVDSSTVGGAEGGPDFLLHPAGDEGRIDLTFTYNRVSSHRLQIAREVGSNQYNTFSIQNTNLEDRVTLGTGGDLPLSNTRYFIRVSDLSTSSELSYTLQSNKQVPFTPTPTDTPSRTPTPTRTNAPTHTPTPSRTPTPTRTFTPSPSPTFTPSPSPTQAPTDLPTPTPVKSPTPVLLRPVDLNGDGRIDGRDVLFLSRWFIPGATDTTAAGWPALMEWIERYREETSGGGS